jgi:hypothetical protein
VAIGLAVLGSLLELDADAILMMPDHPSARLAQLDPLAYGGPSRGFQERTLK